MFVQLNLEKLQAMHRDWHAVAVTKALPVETLRKDLAAAKAQDATFTPDQVGEMLNAISAFYMARGREDAMKELLSDLGAPPVPAKPPTDSGDSLPVTSRRIA